jgi:hypothetical protein
MKAIIGIVAIIGAFVATTVACRTDIGQVPPYTPGWKTHESQSRGLSDAYASRWDRNLHTRVCEAQ